MRKEDNNQRKRLVKRAIQRTSARNKKPPITILPNSGAEEDKRQNNISPIQRYYDELDEKIKAQEEFIKKGGKPIYRERIQNSQDRN